MNLITKILNKITKPAKTISYDEYQRRLSAQNRAEQAARAARAARPETIETVAPETQVHDDSHIVY